MILHDLIETLTVDSITGPQKIRLFDEWADVLNCPDPIVLCIAGEGSGKSLHAGLYLSARLIYDRVKHPEHEHPLYWVVGADFEDARKDFDYFYQFQLQLDNVAEASVPGHFDQQAVVITKMGQTIKTISSYDFTKIARDEPMGIVGAEASRWYAETFERCEGRLIRQYPHSWGFFSGSPEASFGWFKDVATFAEGPNDRSIRSFFIPSWCNLAKYPGGRDDPAILRAEAGRSPQKFAERFGAKFVPPRGLVCHSFNYTLHVDTFLDVDPDLPIYLGIDPGGIVYSVLFVQFTPDGEIHVVDEIYAHRWPHSQVINEFEGHPWRHLVEGGAIDVASKQPQNAMPISLNEWFNDTGLNLWAQKHDVESTVERLYWALSPNPNTGRPRLRINPRCAGLISEMGGGPSPVPDGGAWMRFETATGIGVPMRKNDHSCKALAYLLQGPYGIMAYNRATEESMPVSYVGNELYSNKRDVSILRDDSVSYTRSTRG